MMPVSGIRRMTPPTMTNVCSAMTVVSPTASSLPKPSVRCSACGAPARTARTYSSSTAVTPNSPSSSPIAAKMKSVQANGM